MGRLHDPPHQRAVRRWLRTHSTPAEVRLWAYLKNRRTGHRFRRQHGIGRYVVDFYCAAARLAVELDGGVHARPEVAAYDAARTEALAALGVRVVRFPNAAVAADPAGVAAVLAAACAARTASR